MTSLPRLPTLPVADLRHDDEQTATSGTLDASLPWWRSSSNGEGRVQAFAVNCGRSPRLRGLHAFAVALRPPHVDLHGVARTEFRDLVGDGRFPDLASSIFFECRSMFVFLSSTPFARAPLVRSSVPRRRPKDRVAAISITASAWDRRQALIFSW